MSGVAAVEFGHRFWDGTAGPDEDLSAALTFALKFKPGCVEVVFRDGPDERWQRHDVQPHAPEQRMDALADHIRILTELNNWRGNRLVEVGEHPNPPRVPQKASP